MGGDVARTAVVSGTATGVLWVVIALAGAGLLSTGCGSASPPPATLAMPAPEAAKDPTDWPAPAVPRPSDPARRPPAHTPPGAPDVRDHRRADFEWPPPEASAIAEIEPGYFSSDRTLWDAAHRIRQMLVRHGYEDQGWYTTGTGFAVVTRCERIDGDGTPRQDPRFSMDIPMFHDFSLLGIARAMFSAPQGRFRVIMIAVTSDPASIRRRTHDGGAGTVERLGQHGDAVIPQELQTPPLEGHSALILFYEITKLGDQPPRIVADGLTVDTHVRGSGMEIR
jgi:hypothetical protein